jgi:PAS domain S-box-containing protein
MKNRLLLFQLFFFLTIGMLVAFALLEHHPFVVLAAATLCICAGLFYQYTWSRIIKSVASITSKIDGNRTFSPWWSVNIVDQMKQMQTNIASRYENAAVMISSLRKSDGQLQFDVNDSIGSALSGIHGELQAMKKEDERRLWMSQALAHFSEVLRNKMEIKEYGFQIVCNLVKQLNANQGGLYIEYQDERGVRYLELSGSYAYGKRKFMEGRIEEGQGLLGQAMLERDLVVLNDVPKDYVKITSGLGEATPRCIVVAPLIYSSVFCGVIEIASFEKLQPFQLEYLRKVCENIASEIVTIRHLEKTNALLKASEDLTRELQDREEGMRQNFEELANAQREMKIKQQELSGVINAIDSTLGTAEFNLEGKMMRSNAIFQSFFDADGQSLHGLTFRHLMGANDMAWKSISSGQVRNRDLKTRTIRGTDLWLSMTFTPITDIDQKQTKVLCLVQNITEKKKKEEEFELLSMVTNNTGNSVIITDADGLIEYVNAGFTRMTGYEFDDVVGKKPSTFLQGPLTDQEVVRRIRTDLKAGIPLFEEILNYNKSGETYWVSLAISPVKDADGMVTKFISIQSEITETKRKALDFHQKMEALSRSNAIIEIDRNGTVLDINENYLRILGYSRDEVLGNPYSQLGSSDNVFEKLMDTIRRDGLQNGVYPRYDKQGSKHFIKLMDYPVLDMQGEIERIIEFGLDVSNEKRLEKETERKQAELKSYLAGINNTIASASFDLNGNFLEGNDIFMKVMGYSGEELSGRTFECLMGEDQNVTLMWANLGLGKFFSGEFRMKNKAGQSVWLNGTFNPIMIEGNTPEKIMMFAQFTSQEKEKLNELSSIVNAMKSTLPVIEFNAEFMCKTANDKAMRIFALSRMDVRSKSVLDFVAPNFHNTWNKQKEEILNNHHTTTVLPLIAGSNMINYEVTFSVNRNLEGRIVRIVALLVREVLDRIPVFIAN